MTPTQLLIVLVLACGSAFIGGAAWMGVRTRDQAANAFTSGLSMGFRLRPRHTRHFNERRLP